MCLWFVHQLSNYLWALFISLRYSAFQQTNGLARDGRSFLTSLMFSKFLERDLLKKYYPINHKNTEDFKDFSLSCTFLQRHVAVSLACDASNEIYDKDAACVHKSNLIC